MDSRLDIEALATEMKAAQDGARSIVPLSSRFAGLDMADAYRIAGRIHRQRLQEGARAVGRKIGFSNRTIWPTYGVHEPIWAHVYDRTVEMLPSAHARSSLSRFVEPRIEPEIVFGLRDAPPRGADPAGLLACIEWVAHGFEIVQSHAPGWRFKAPDTVADQALHGRLLVGPKHPPAVLGARPLEALREFRLDLLRDGEVMQSGCGANVLGSPLEALAYLLGMLAAPGEHRPLSAGELVTTGTITDAPPVRAGERWETRLHGLSLPGLELELVE